MKKTGKINNICVTCLAGVQMVLDQIIGKGVLTHSLTRSHT